MNPTNHPSFIFKNLNETLKTLPQYSPFPYHKKCSTLETTLPNKNIKNLVHNCPKLAPRQKLIQTNYRSSLHNLPIPPDTQQIRVVRKPGIEENSFILSKNSLI